MHVETVPAPLTERFSPAKLIEDAKLIIYIIFIQSVQHQHTQHTFAGACWFLSR